MSIIFCNLDIHCKLFSKLSFSYFFFISWLITREIGYFETTRGGIFVTIGRMYRYYMAIILLCSICFVLILIYRVWIGCDLLVFCFFRTGTSFPLMFLRTCLLVLLIIPLLVLRALLTFDMYLVFSTCLMFGLFSYSVWRLGNIVMVYMVVLLGIVVIL